MSVLQRLSVSSSPVGLPLLSLGRALVVEVFVFAKLWIPKHQVSRSFVSQLRRPTRIPQSVRWAWGVPVSLWPRWTSQFWTHQWAVSLDMLRETCFSKDIDSDMNSGFL